MAPLLILVGILFILAQAHATDDTCDRTYKKAGCFRGNKAGMVLAITDRDDSSRNYSGRYLEWGSYSKDLHSLICRCDNKAKELGYEYFAIEYYAECWMVSNITLVRSDPAPQECVNVNITTCGEADKECAGKGFHQQVYKAGEIWLSVPFANSTGIARSLVILQTFPKEYMVQMNITFNSSGYYYIIRCSTDDLDVPIYITRTADNLSISSQLRRQKGADDWYESSNSVQNGKGIEVIVSQILRGGKYMRSVIIDGKEDKESENKHPTAFGKTRCTARADGVDVAIRNGVIKVKQSS